MSVPAMPEGLVSAIAGGATDMPPQGPGGCDNQPTAAESIVGMEALMASKDKGGRTPKKAAAKNLKQKRLEKKAKRSGSAGKTSIG